MSTALLSLTSSVLLLVHPGAEPPVPEAASALERYVQAPDDRFDWRVQDTEVAGGATTALLALTSQRWRTADEVSDPDWRHWMRICIPAEREGTTALLIIDGGRRRDRAPAAGSGLLTALAVQTKSIVVQLPNVPNQPLEIGGDGRARYEDDLIAQSWVVAGQTGDLGWVAQLPMVKSASAAMTAAQAYLRSQEGGGIDVDGFVVTGASKRGWTTWLTAAVDPRVRAIMPIVIDTLNLEQTVQHHWGAYGFWAPAIGDYAGRGLARWLGTEEGLAIRTIVDPFMYRDRLTMPKFLLNSAGDQYFLPDTTRYYLGDLPGVTRLRVVPNTDHDVARDPAAVTSLMAFYTAIIRGADIPDLSWTIDADTPGTVRVTPGASPLKATLWQAFNPAARDFRMEAIGPVWSATGLEPAADGSIVAGVDVPSEGFRAFLVEVVMPVQGQPLPVTFTTEVFVLPDVLPHADKPME